MMKIRKNPGKKSGNWIIFWKKSYVWNLKIKRKIGKIRKRIRKPDEIQEKKIILSHLRSKPSNLSRNMVKSWFAQNMLAPNGYLNYPVTEHDWWNVFFSLQDCHTLFLLLTVSGFSRTILIYVKSFPNQVKNWSISKKFFLATSFLPKYVSKVIKNVSKIHSFWCL